MKRESVPWSPPSRGINEDLDPSQFLARLCFGGVSVGRVAVHLGTEGRHQFRPSGRTSRGRRFESCRAPHGRTRIANGEWGRTRSSVGQSVEPTPLGLAEMGDGTVRAGSHQRPNPAEGESPSPFAREGMEGWVSGRCRRTVNPLLRARWFKSSPFHQFRPGDGRTSCGTVPERFRRGRFTVWGPPCCKPARPAACRRGHGAAAAILPCGPNRQ